MTLSVAPPTFPLPSRYKYDNETLDGGQGAVYICRDKLLDRRVAVKALHTMSNAPSMIKELEARAKIKSKHVVEVYEVLTAPNSIPFALVMEYISGNTLWDKSNHPKDTKERLRLLYQLACGIADIHAANVIHRDIKPQNIKIDDNGVLKIFDLGISNLDADNASTVGGAGTYIFLGPEFYGRLPLSVTRAADIYAFGVIAWHILAPIIPQCLIDLPPQNAKSAPLPPISGYSSDIGQVASLIDACLAILPAARPTAEQLKEKLRKEITQGRKRGLFAYGAQTWELQTIGKVIRLTVGSLGTLMVGYDGYDFAIKDVTGAVFVNNEPAAIGYLFPESCVLTFGDPSLRSARGFVTFNASQPAIVL
jgi:eukaryotic-like serine/threonine-protein kinase